MKFLNPTTDTAFKRLFGDKHRKNLTINFLNSLLERNSGNLITEITFRDTAHIPDTIDGKFSCVDINCIDQSGNHFIIEMQVAKEAHFLQRAQFYAASALSRQLKKAETYKNLQPVIFIAIMRNQLFLDNQDAITHHLICNTKTGKQSMRHLEFHYVELNNFHKQLDELVSNIDKWLYFLKHAEDLDVVPHVFEESKDFIEAFHVMEKSLWSPADLIKYRADLDRMYRDTRLQEGMVEAGIEIGAQKSREEIARNLLQEGLSINLVAKSTKLSVKRIAELVEEMKI